MLVTSPSNKIPPSKDTSHHTRHIQEKNKANKIKNMAHEPHQSLNWAHQKESYGFVAACWLSRSAQNSHYQGLQPWPSKRCYRQCCGLVGCLVAMLRSCLRTWMSWWVRRLVLCNMCRTHLGMTRLHCQPASWTHHGPRCKLGQPIWWKQCLKSREMDFNWDPSKMGVKNFDDTIVLHKLVKITSK